MHHNYVGKLVKINLFDKMQLHMSKNKILNLIKPTINEIAKYVPGESEVDGEKNVIKLSSNESPFKIPKKVFSSANKLLEQSNLYPDGDSVLLKYSISKKFRIDKSKIICGNGSDDILSLITQTFGRENSEVICSEFGFIYYPIISKISGAKVVTAKSKNLSVSCENILKKISQKTRIIFIANPNNPTGSIILKKELRNFLKNIPKNIIVVVDGAYAEFVTNPNYSDGLELVKSFPNLIITRTFSKIFALAGLRLGWAYGSKEIIETLEKVRGPFNVNLLAQKIGSLVLNEKDFLKKSIIHNGIWQKKLSEFINSLGLEAKQTFANFILVKIDKNKFNKKLILKELLKNKILIRDLESYGLKEFIRISIGTKGQMNKFMKTLKQILKKK